MSNFGSASKNPFLEDDNDSEDEKDERPYKVNRPTKKTKNPFSDESDDVRDADFLKSAPTRPWSGTSRLRQDEQLQSLIDKKREIEERTLQSSISSLRILSETEEVGAQTAEELLRQREQLERTNNRLDDMNQQLRVSERHIQNIKSVFSSMKNYFFKAPTATPPPSEVKSSQSSSALRTALEPAVGDKKIDSEHPALRLKGLSETRSQSMDSPYSVDDQLERNLGDMSSALSRLKGLGLGLQEEIEEQNALLDRMQDKSEKVDWKLNKQNKEMSKILKK